MDLRVEDLSQEESERCATALWGEPDIHVCGNGKRHWESMMSIRYFDELEHDPRYWFPRLFDKLKGFKPSEGMRALFEIKEYTTIREDCISLCSIIEQAKEKHR